MTSERLQIPTTPVASSIRSVRAAAAVAGPKASANVISGNQALPKPAASALTAYSIESGAGRPVRKMPSTSA